MQSAFPNVHNPPPPFATIQSDSGVVELCVRSIMAKWVKISLIPLAFSLVALFVAIVSVLNHYGSIDTWPPLAMSCALIVGGLAMFFVAILALFCVLIGHAKGRATITRTTLLIQDFGASYEIPRSHICGIRQVAYPGKRLEFNISDAPSCFFFRGRRTAVELQLPGGRLECFHFWGEPKVTWLSANLRHLLLKDDSEEPQTEVDPGQRGNVVISGRLYGKSRRWLVRIVMAAGVIGLTLTGWDAYRGLSSSHWPTVLGQVVRSHYEETINSENEKHSSADIQYTYEVSHRKYKNNDFGFEREAGDDVVKRLVADHPGGSTIKVYYDPERPADSIVIPGLGPIQWVIVAPFVVCVVMILPVALRRTTPEQDDLSAVYKIRVDPDTPSPAIEANSIRWSIPEDAWRYTIRNTRCAVFWMSVRICLLTALALWAAHHWFAPLMEPDFPWRRINEIMMAMALLQLLAIFSSVFLMRGRPGEYAVTREGIRVPSRELSLIRWRTLIGYAVHPHESLPHQVLALRSKSAGHREIVLPDGDLQHSILARIAEELPQSSAPEAAIPMRSLDWLGGFCAVVGVIWAGGVYLSRHPSIIHKNPEGVNEILLVGMLLGPGTWIAILLRKRRVGAQLIVFAGVLNLIATFGTLVAAIVMRLSMVAK